MRLYTELAFGVDVWSGDLRAAPKTTVLAYVLDENRKKFLTKLISQTRS